MTLPVERTRAVLMVEQEARRLSNVWGWTRASEPRPKYMTIPFEEWQTFMRLFRHYPTAFELSESAKKCPEIWSDETPNP